MIALIPFPEISPEIFSISLFGIDFALRWYAMAYIVGILLGYALVLRALKRTVLWPNNSPIMTSTQVEDMLGWIILGVILGGRLGYVLFYQPDYYLRNPVEILYIWQGGMAFHGGLVGVVTAAYLYGRKYDIPKFSLADLVVLGVPPGLLLGRIANFINAELWGRQTDVPWAVAFPGEEAQYCPDVLGICGRHPSQLYEAGLEGLFLGLAMIVLVWSLQILKRPGALCGVFLGGYGAARFLVEFFRQPDAQFISDGNPLGLALHMNGWGLTMGQLLSLPMIVLGLWLILRARGPQTAT